MIGTPSPAAQRLEDITEAERARLVQLKKDKGLPPTIQETTTTSSLPYLEETSNCDPKMHNVVSDGAPCQFTMHYVVSDGAPCQFTKHHARSATYIDWSVGTPAHKDMSDAECGGVKHDNMAIVRPVDGSRTVSL